MNDELVVEFDQTIHSIDALNAAAYRLIGIASCRIEREGGKYVCHLSPEPTSTDLAGIRSRFVDLVTDEQLRERSFQDGTGSKPHPLVGFCIARVAER